MNLQSLEKYQVSFKLDKCEFLKDRVELVGHNVLSDSLYQAQSKFDIINNWTLPSTVQSLHSFIGLINFYHNYAPYLEIRLKPLLRLNRYFWKKYRFNLRRGFSRISK